MVRGIITYYLSPFQQKVFSNFISSSIRGGINRVKLNWLHITPALSAFVLLHWWADKKSHEIKLHHRD